MHRFSQAKVQKSKQNACKRLRFGAINLASDKNGEQSIPLSKYSLLPLAKGCICKTHTPQYFRQRVLFFSQKGVFLSKNSDAKNGII